MLFKFQFKETGGREKLKELLKYNEPYLDIICLGSMEETMKKICGTKGYYIKIY